MPMTRALRLIWLAALAAVIVGSVLPAQSAAMSLIDRAGINDKVEHFIAYAVLAALPSLDRFRCRRLRATIAFLFLLGALLELAQLLSPGRTCDWHDLLADSCGIVAGVGLVRISRLAFRLHLSPAPPAD
jgi:VanZ family protein